MNRAGYLGLGLLTVVLGLASRKFAGSLPEFVGEFAGDTLWALMVYWFSRWAFHSRPKKHALIFSLAFSLFIELSQLYQADWANELRDYKLVALVFGHGFLWTDLVCYSVGIVFGFLVDYWLFAKRLTATP